jgi:peptidoglycan hydrolase-like protein with peptidoglycan-binding domain
MKKIIILLLALLLSSTIAPSLVSAHPKTRVIIVDRGYPSRAVVKAAQRVLRAEGLYHGPIDGILGPATRSAIRKYQYRHYLRVTGRLDRPTIRAMALNL